jgi:hypothetical protein
MSNKETIGKKILQDLHMGMSDNALMEKYRLSYGELRGLYKSLFDAGQLKPADGPERVTSPSVGGSPGRTRRTSRRNGSVYDSSFMLPPDLDEDSRKTDRYDVDFDMPVYEAQRPEIQGRVVDITETGAQLTGVRAEVGSAITVVALGDTFSDIAPFEFQALCKWIKEEEPDGNCTGGFEITEISEESLFELRKLIQSIDLGI